MPPPPHTHMLAQLVGIGPGLTGAFHVEHRLLVLRGVREHATGLLSQVGLPRLQGGHEGGWEGEVKGGWGGGAGGGLRGTRRCGAEGKG